MNQLNDWIARQASRERSLVRLEDALLANRFGRYFFHRLRFLFARSAISTVIHAAKVVLLLGSFPRSEFLVIVVMQGSVALAGDFWWGALEYLRSQIRDLQRRGARHVIPREIARWLTLGLRVAVGVILVVGAFVVDRLLVGRLGPVDALVAALVMGAALDLVARAYHSGAYALRRVYRPLPSLLALDVVSVGGLLALWPFIGIWAFPVAELASVLVVISISIHYTSRTYRTLALPTLVPLLRSGATPPRRRAMRASLAPGVSYAVVGLEALIVVAGIATAQTAAGATLVVLLAAIAPVSRASFEWARLLYFDLKRLDVPVLADLRRKFDRAIVWLALAMGVIGGLVAVAVGAAVLRESASVTLGGALLLLFIVRSLLAAAQMQAFTREAYARLALAGVLGVALVAATFAVTLPADIRIVAIAAALGVSWLVLLAIGRSRRVARGVLPVPDWLGALRRSTGPVTVTRLRFDARLHARGTIAERRRAESWRRQAVADRISNQVARHGGAATWGHRDELWVFQPVRTAPKTAAVASSTARPAPSPTLRIAAGLVDSQPVVTEWPDPRAAALALAGSALAESLPTIQALIDDFGRRFPTGIAYEIDGSRPPSALLTLDGAERARIQRAAIRFARGLDSTNGRDKSLWDVSSATVDGSLRAIFVVDRRVNASARRAWRANVRNWNIRAAAGALTSGSQPVEDPDGSASAAVMI
ncbi:MAG: hypothetical protein ABIP53_06435 [Candidatus Limnocylindrales bacterium]